jgi:hypothetical protein
MNHVQMIMPPQVHFGAVKRQKPAGKEGQDWLKFYYPTGSENSFFVTATEANDLYAENAKVHEATVALNGGPDEYLKRCTGKGLDELKESHPVLKALRALQAELAQKAED